MERQPTGGRGVIKEHPCGRKCDEAAVYWWSGCQRGTPPAGGGVMERQPTGGRGVIKEHPLREGV